MFWYLLWQLWTASGITFLKRLSDDVTKAIFWSDWMHFVVLSRQETAAIVVGCYLVHLFLWLSHHVTVSSIAHFWHLQSASRHWLSVFCNLRYSYFYRAMLCIRGTSHGPVSLRPSVRPSVTSRCSTKTAKRRITQTTPHDSPGTLVFWSQRSPRNSTGVTPYGGTKCRWGGSKSATFDK